MNLKNKIKTVKDFPIKGIEFKDISILLEDGKYFNKVLQEMNDKCKIYEIDKIAGIESRGWLFSAPLAYMRGVGHVMLRKGGKLPRETLSVRHQLEYGEGVLEMHRDSIKRGEKVLIVDDVLATGGTANAAIKLIENAGGIVVGLSFLIELRNLNGAKKLSNYTHKSVIIY